MQPGTVRCPTIPTTTGPLIEFVPKFVKPVEDRTTGLTPESLDGSLDGASPEIRRLLSLTYLYPQPFGLSQGGNEIGRADKAGAA